MRSSRLISETKAVNSTPGYLTVSQLNQLLNEALEESFPKVQFQAEISQVTAASSGHVYLKLKDEKSQIDGVIWRGVAERIGFKLAIGMAVLCEGRPNVYQAAGRLQMVLSKVSPAGEGALRRKFLELKEKLEKEGLFALERKRRLPFLPSAVGVVTSGQGAVIHDIMVKIRERMPSLPVYLVETRVQGEGAAQEIAAGIQLLNQFGKVDVIIVGRGGGSLEDLWAFNEEAVVRAIFASQIPVVSGVGHEVDVSLSDLVADVRAPTPTAAAEMIVPKLEDLLFTISDFWRRLVDYDRWLLPLAQGVDDLEARLLRKVEGVISEASLRVSHAEAKLRLLEPYKLIETFRERLQMSLDRLSRGIEGFVLQRKHGVERLVGRLEALNPLSVLGRGYSLVELGGRLVRSSAEVKVGDSVAVTFSEGRVAASITEKIS